MGTLVFNIGVDIAAMMEEFKSITSNAAMVEYAESKVSDIAYVDEDGSEKPNSPMRVSKNNLISKKIRQQGNKELRNRNLVKALELFNQSICYAETDTKTEELAFGYGNRSLVYFELKKYDLCLENIQRAKQYDYSKQLMDKLNRRELQCKKLWTLSCNENREDNDAPLTPTLNFTPNPNVPFISHCLKLHENVEFGRHIVTDCDLSVGQLIAFEDSYCAVLKEELKYQRCANCMQENNFNLIPCENCTSVMFCSDDCATEAYKNFHQIECSIIDFLLDKCYDFIAVRMTLRAITSIADLDELRNFIDDPETEKINAFTLDYREPMSSSDFYKAIYTLDTNQEKRLENELFTFSAAAAILYRTLMKHTAVIDLLNSENDKNLLMELLFRNLQIVSINRNELGRLRFSQIPSGSTHFDEIKNAENICNFQHGWGVSAFNSLINHSCAANIVRVYCGTRSIFFVLQPIKAGDQLFVNYGYSYQLHDLATRQEKLLSQFHFKCKCIACEKNYTIKDDLKITNIPTISNVYDFTGLRICSKAYARYRVPSFINYLNEYIMNENIHPCLQTTGIQHFLTAALSVLYNYTPFRFVELNIGGDNHYWNRLSNFWNRLCNWNCLRN